MYKVFNQNRLIIFTENLTSYEYMEEAQLVEWNSSKNIYSVYQEFICQSTPENLIILAINNIEEIVKKFFSMFKIIEAAGGLIKNSKDELLMIYRLGRWDLPKGKIKKKEGIIQAALRECMEETGLKQLSIIKELEKTYHIYELDNTPILKTTHWFEMFSQLRSNLIPQYEEEIEKAVWMDRVKVEMAMHNTYESLKDLIRNNYLEE